MSGPHPSGLAPEEGVSALARHESASRQGPAIGPLFTVDEVNDRNCASGGHSRYGSYLAVRMADPKFFGPDAIDDPLLWATFAWEVATPPIMHPGYLTWADPIENAFVFPSADHDLLMAEVVVRTDLPAPLPGWKSWNRLGGHTLTEPFYGQRTALTRVTLTVVLDTEPVPAPGERAGHVELVRSAQASVHNSAGATEQAVGECLHALAAGPRSGTGSR